MARAIKPREFITRDQAAAMAAQERPKPIWIHLWPTAPGLETVACNDERRWHLFWGTPLSLVLRRLLNRLERAPQLVEVREHGSETDLVGEHELAPGYGFLPLATFATGVTFEAVAEAHQDLIENNWRPRAKAGAAPSPN